MKFIKLVAVYNTVKRVFDFSEGTTLIFSEENSVGKSTLLRILFYSLGYSIPGTQKVNFDKLNTTLEICIEDTRFTIERSSKQLNVKYGKKNEEFILPENQDEFLELIFKNSDLNILDNILGAIYLDQDKGWTLLNRGIVIGNIRFNIENLVAGLADIDIAEEQNAIVSYKKQLSKYKGLNDINDFQKEFLRTDTISNSSEIDKINDKLSILSSRKQILNNKIRDLNHSMKENKSFISQLEKLQLKVRIPDSSETISVNKDTIEGYDDNVDFLQMRKWSLKEELAKTENDIKKIQNKKLELNGQMDLFGDTGEIEKTSQLIETIKIDTAIIDAKIIELTNKIDKINQQIRKKLSSRSAIVDEMSELILDYSTRLNVASYLPQTANFLFLNKLKGLSGTVLHKLVLSFKLAYIKMLEKKLGLRLPIVLDSPSGREVTADNVSEMMEILEKDFTKNQKIIASIFDDRIKVDSKIELYSKTKLFIASHQDIL